MALTQLHTSQRLAQDSRFRIHGRAYHAGAWRGNLLPERSLNLRGPPSPAVNTPAKRSNARSAQDWRYEAITIESIDMEATASKAEGAKSAVGSLHTKAVYTPSDPKSTDVGYGVVHLYRDLEEASHLGDEQLARRNLEIQRPKRDDFDPEQCTTLCILAMPSWMTPAEFLGFVGDQAREDVSHFRMIRTSTANRYMVLLKFRSARKAKEWQKANNGRLFSPGLPENCHVVFIKSVEFLAPDSSDVASSEGDKFPNNTHDPFTSAHKEVSSKRMTKSLSGKPFPPPPPNLLELPTCPVCLERMDETTGLLTILCQHVFHCACLEKWRGSGCPVCRYTHSPSYTFPYPRPNGSREADDAPPMCSVCARMDSLWICMICGTVGCGRYESAHAKAHYLETSHCYAMDIHSQHVWDYAGDGYVHRLLQSKPMDAQEGGQGLIDMPNGRERHENEGFRAEPGDTVPREKMESMTNEFMCLLSDQLELQRRYFAEQLERAADERSEAKAHIETLTAKTAEDRVAIARTESSLSELKQTSERLEKALEKAEKARAKFESMARGVTSQFREEKMLSEGLSQRVKTAEDEAKKAKEEAKAAVDAKKDAEEMNHDLTMYVSGLKKVEELAAQGEEIADGTAYVPEQRKGKGKGRKK